MVQTSSFPYVTTDQWEKEANTATCSALAVLTKGHTASPGLVYVITVYSLLCLCSWDPPEIHD